MASSDNTLFDADETLTVGQINKRLSTAIKRALPREIWVQGQIRNLSRSARGHVYFDLVDPVQAGEQPKAAISVTLFDSTKQMVNRTIKRTGNNVRMDDGVEVRIRAMVDFYAPRGQVQLNMLAIDPEFTLGRLGVDRARLLETLAAEELLQANAAVPLPMVPLRVALITSAGSAAQADFIEQIRACGYRFEVSSVDTRVQGEFAGQEVTQAILTAIELAPDVIAIVRGGGARTDLAAFDAEPVARAIATSPIPVICGIGHEIDTSVADLVAHASFKTPTACAQFVIERVVTFDFELRERAERLAQSARVLPVLHEGRLDLLASRTTELVSQRLESARRDNQRTAANLERRVTHALVRADHGLVNAQSQVARLSAQALNAGRTRCDSVAEQLRSLPLRHLRDHQQRLEVHQARLDAVDPQRALRRGWSITTNAQGKVVRSVVDVEVADTLLTRLADGTVTSTVTATTATTRSSSPSPSPEEAS